MNATTQISGGYNCNNQAVFALKKKLQNLSVQVTHPMCDGFFVKNASREDAKQQSWTPYEINVDYYQAIAGSDFHIVYNAVGSGLITEDLAREIAYAMSVKKPIILLHPPRFDDKAPYFIRKLIENHLGQIIVCDLSAFDELDTEWLIKSVAAKRTSYNLSNQEKTAIDRAVRAFFRTLLISNNRTARVPLSDRQIS